jgi:glycoside/pentoside/hexuronide:cation symporter, GPH family
MTISPKDTNRLSTGTKLLYGLGDVGNATANTAVIFFLLIFYTDAVLISPALAGSALLIGKIWDAVNDPLFGWISDRTSATRFGKRRVYMIFGAIPLGLSIALLWFVPQGLSTTAIFIWIVLTFILFDTFITMTSVPYYALTAELTPDYDERSSLTAFRMLLGIPAYMIGAAATPALVGLFALARSGYAYTGILYGVIAALTLLVAGLGLRERPDVAASQSQFPPLQAVKLTFRNRPFVLLISAYLIANLGFVLVQTLFAYFVIYQLDMPEMVPLVMLIILLSVLIFIFPWKAISDRWSKGPAYALGLGIGALSVAALFFLPQGPTPLVYVIAFTAGLGFSTNWIFPWSMVPDVVEYDQLETGEYRSGMYYGVWGFAFKLTNALGVAIAGWVLQLFGYVANAAQTPEALLGMRLFVGPVPAVILAISLPLLVRFPITRQKHAEVRAKLAERAAG